MEQEALDAVQAMDPATRTLFLGFLAVTPLLGLVPGAWSWIQLSRFLRRVPRLATPQDLQAFKAVARWQMYGALLQIAVLVTPWAIFLAGLATDALTRADGLYSTGAFVVVMVGGFVLRTLEKRVQDLPCATPELEQARDAVVRTWLTKPLPDWQG